ncbi:MAG: glycerophosphodiester phosphodiesterase [Salinarimonadaceae bacterium]|nr:MAG: glycerophosphodiester phosphodiesterase [Salinarimonadaceae bacterium]
MSLAPLNAPDWLVARPIAHRGLHAAGAGVIENSLAAARAAVARGFAIECDVQDSADGEAMVFHDHELARLTGENGVLRERRADAIARLTLAGSGERVPSLSELLATVAGHVPLVVEIKSRFDADPRLTRRTLALLAGYDGPACVKSCDPFVVALAREIAPERPRGIVGRSVPDGEDGERPGRERARDMSDLAMSELLHFERTQPDFLSWRAKDLPCVATHLCRTLRGMPVMTWTLRDAQAAGDALAYADQIIFESFDPQG